VNSTGGYSVTITDANGCKASSASTIVTITPCTFTWTGIASSDWNNAGNWDKGTVPMSFEDASIAAGTPYSPIITGSIGVRTLTINTGATFTVSSGASITSNGDLNNNGTFADNGGTITFNGTNLQSISGTTSFSNLIINNPSGVKLNNVTNVRGILTLTNGNLISNGNLNVNLTNGAIDYNASDNGSISGNITVTKSVPSIKTHYVASPLNGSTSGDFYDDVQVINPSTSLTRLFSWDIPTQAWVGMYGTGTTLPVMTGNSIFYPTISAASVLDYTGTYTHKATPAPLTYTSVPLNGYVLIGNPYPSVLDWNNSSAWTKNNINNAIYFWDAKNSRYASYVNGIGTNGGTQYIPSMQAFYVVAATAGNVTVGVDNSARLTTSASGMWRVGTPSNTLKLVLNSGNYNDETLIRFSDYASDEFDGNLDALKLKNPDLAPSFYTWTGNDEYSINTLSSSSNKTIPLSIMAGFSGTYTISQSEIATFDSDYSIILEDKLLKTFTDLKNQNYTFSINEGEEKNRFNLIYKNSESTGNQFQENSVLIYSDGKEVMVNYSNLPVTDAMFCLYNTMGQLISKNNLNGSSGSYIFDAINCIDGVYIVKIVAGNKVYSSKVYLTK
jgi:hypothetical protein